MLKRVGLYAVWDQEVLELGIFEYLGAYFLACEENLKKNKTEKRSIVRHWEREDACIKKKDY